MAEYALELKNITKRFSGVLALDNVNLQVKQGEIHALCGENGAGKSTLINILSGVYPYGTYEGSIVMNGQEIKSSGIIDSEKAGIVCIHQELALFQELSVAENIFMGRHPAKHGVVDWNKLYAESAKYMKMLGLEIHLDEKVKNLGTGQKQLIEIVKALVRNPKYLILDEPTSSLAEQETDLLLSLLDDLRNQGVTCIYISHKLDEVKRIADSITILRDGRTIISAKSEDLPKAEIIRNMVGREMRDMFPREKHTAKEVAFEIRNYSVRDPASPDRLRIDNVSIQARRGEILGVSGLVGAGRTELFSSIFGAYGMLESGEVYIDGVQVQNKNPAEAVRNGYILATEDRKRYGLNLVMDIKQNITLGSLKSVSKHGLLDENMEIQAANRYIDLFHIKAPGFYTRARNLSGGNQQKVVLGKSMMMQPKVLVFDEPTRGIDVGAKYEIYKLMNQFVDEGVVVIMISSEMEEIMGMSDHVVAMCDGKVTADLPIEEVTQERLLKALMGEMGNE